MRLMTRIAIEWRRDFRYIVRIHAIRYRVPVHRVSEAILDRQLRDASEVVLGQPDFPVEDRNDVFGFEFLGLCIRTVALHAERVDRRGPKQLGVVSAVGLVTSCASLLERWLVKMRFLVLLRLIAVAVEADVDRIGLGKPWGFRRVWIVTIRAIALSTWVLNFRVFDVLRLLVMAGYAKRFGVLFSKDDFSILRRLMARRTGIFIGERRMDKFVDQLRAFRFVRVVARKAISFVKGLIIVSFFQIRTRRVVTIKAELRSRFRKVIIEFALSDFACLVRNVASAATHIQRSVAATTLRNINSDFVAGEAEVLVLVFAFSGFKQLVLVR